MLIYVKCCNIQGAKMRINLNKLYPPTMEMIDAIYVQTSDIVSVDRKHNGQFYENIITLDKAEYRFQEKGHEMLILNSVIGYERILELFRKNEGVAGLISSELFSETEKLLSNIELSLS